MLAVRTGTLVMLLVALLFGGLAVVIAKFWLASQQVAVTETAQPQVAPIQTETIVVANKDLRFGEPLTPEVLREVVWPKEALPEGAFSKISDLDKDGRRVVLTPIGPSEPVLASKISGPGGRATLSSLVEAGMRAVTIRVNDTSGVAGFVLPGDRVDVLYTKGGDAGSTIDVLFQNVRVLAINQNADEKNANPIDGRVATLELTPVDAQKLSLAESTGALSFTLRAAGSLDTAPSDRIVENELVQNTSLYQMAVDAEAKTKSELERRIQELEGKVKEADAKRAEQIITDAKPQVAAATPASDEAQLPTTAEITIYRGLKGSSYTVPLDANP